jgi:hypothetical protein
MQGQGTAISGIRIETPIPMADSTLSESEDPPLPDTRIISITHNNRPTNTTTLTNTASLMHTTSLTNITITYIVTTRNHRCQR